jgi:hypothetical protein
MVGQGGQEANRVIVHCQRGTDVGFTSTPRHLDSAWQSLLPAQPLLRTNPHHYFAKTQEHPFSPPNHLAAVRKATYRLLQFTPPTILSNHSRLAGE